jgi:uncharacterized protein (TIGR03437 family)
MTVAYTINVTPSQSDATWIARSDQEWLRITSGSAGRGPRTLTYAIDANASPQTRTAVIKIGSASVAVTETGMTVPFATVSAASFAPSVPLAPGVIAVGYGANLVPAIESAPAAGPLPAVLAQTSVRVRDSVGVERTAPLWFVSPSQIIYYIPGETALGLATITVVRNSQTVVTGTLRIDTVAPGLFTMNANGQGVPAALAIFAKGDGSETRQYVFNTGCQVGSCQPAPLDLGAVTDQVWLWLYGTGIRGRSALGGVSATIGGVNAPVADAGAVAGTSGLDRVNLRVPRSLIGRGELDVVLTVDGKTANTVRVNIK